MLKKMVTGMQIARIAQCSY